MYQAILNIPKGATLFKPIHSCKNKNNNKIVHGKDKINHGQSP